MNKKTEQSTSESVPKELVKAYIEQETHLPFLQSLFQSKTLVIMLLVFISFFGGLLALIIHLAN